MLDEQQAYSLGGEIALAELVAAAGHLRDVGQGIIVS